MGGPPLRGNYVINTPEATPTPHSVLLTHTDTHTDSLALLCVTSCTDPDVNLLASLLMKRPFSHK